jgi:threonine dehydrogenase-like Zn-dependent dehydrogenase
LLTDLPRERFADLVVDCTGSPSGFETSCQILKPRGTLVLKTTTASPTGPNLAPVVIDEITIVGSRCGPFAPAIQALSQGNVDVHSLITSRFPLAEGIQALQKAAQKDQLKVLLEIGTE